MANPTSGMSCHQVLPVVLPVAGKELKTSATTPLTRSTLLVVWWRRCGSASEPKLNNTPSTSGRSVQKALVMHCPRRAGWREMLALTPQQVGYVLMYSSTAAGRPDRHTETAQASYRAPGANTGACNEAPALHGPAAGSARRWSLRSRMADTGPHSDVSEQARRAREVPRAKSAQAGRGRERRLVETPCSASPYAKPALQGAARGACKDGD